MKKFLAVILAVLMSVLMIAGCGQQAVPAPEEPAPEAEAPAEPAPEAEAPAEPASEEEEAEPEVVLVPVFADQLNDGTYQITVESSSSMFKVVNCELVVANGEMNATMTMSGQGYGFVFMGTGEEAPAEPDETSAIPFVLNDEGMKNFTVPLEALDQETDCAAWSIKKSKWYDRVLVFQSAGLPAEAFKAE